MAVLSWGKPTIKAGISTDGAVASFDIEIPTPKSGTTQLTATAGTETTAVEEGGAVVDSKYEKTSYELTFDLFVKKGETLPIEDEDGIVTSNYGFQIIPEDSACPAIQIDCASVRCETSYSSEDGILVTVTAKVLKPKTGKMVKIATISS